MKFVYAIIINCLGRLFLPIVFYSKVILVSFHLHFCSLSFFDKYFCSPIYIVLCQVAIEVEREEDEGGLVGETFTDYVSDLFFKT